MPTLRPGPISYSRVMDVGDKRVYVKLQGLTTCNEKWIDSVCIDEMRPPKRPTMRSFVVHWRKKRNGTFIADMWRIRPNQAVAQQAVAESRS
jgi:hypothetical protein